MGDDDEIWQDSSGTIIQEGPLAGLFASEQGLSRPNCRRQKGLTKQDTGTCRLSSVVTAEEKSLLALSAEVRGLSRERRKYRCLKSLLPP